MENDPPEEAATSALLRLLERERSKLEQASALREAIERRRRDAASAPRAIPDPFAPSHLEDLLQPAQAPALAWMESRRAFLSELRERLAGADARERAFFWLGSACGFLGTPAGDVEELRGTADRLRAALRYYEDLERATRASDAPEAYRRDEPWDASGGLAPARRLRAAWILREALELVEEQGAALEVLAPE